MKLGSKATSHETLNAQRYAVRSEDYADFAVNQPVMTVDGFPGTVTAILDGPFPGTEAYRVSLDNDMGGGEYRTSDLSPMATTTAAGLHQASDDYPELGDILQQRPDIAHTGSVVPEKTLRAEARDDWSPAGSDPRWIRSDDAAEDGGRNRWEHHDMDAGVTHSLTQTQKFPSRKYEFSSRDWHHNGEDEERPRELSHAEASDPHVIGREMLNRESAIKNHRYCFHDVDTGKCHDPMHQSWSAFSSKEDSARLNTEYNIKHRV